MVDTIEDGRRAARPFWRWVRRIVTLVLLALTFTTLIALGTWQMHRLAWKEALLSDIAERRAMPPIGIDKIGGVLASGGDVDYRPVNITGTFDHTREQFFFATYNGEAGYYVYTPLKLAGGEYIFVNRGFIPYDKKDAATRAAGQVTGEVTVTGLARSKLLGKPSWAVPDNDPAKNIFYWKDLDAMTAHAGFAKARVLQFFVDANDAPNPGGLPIGGVTQFDFPNNHLQYALTWYGLAAALAAVVAIGWFRGRKTGTEK
ncbi:SURF1 family protein [Rhizobium sp. C1]|uniref:SURF1 family protein n=1 Tax=Rhizobium sp. C1 TaxID=1349799 RepID=UPI003FA7950B